MTTEQIEKAHETAPNTRDAILDAAERIFAEKGYNAATLREISADAGANLGLINYYFKTKDRLFAAVVARRYGELHHMVKTSVDAAKARGGDPRAVMRAFLAPIADCVTQRGEGWRNYMTLLARGMSAFQDVSLQPTLRGLASIGDILRDTMAESFPASAGEAVDLSTYVVEAAIIFITQDKGVLDARSRGRHAVMRLHEIVDQLADFFIGGYVALVRS